MKFNFFFNFTIVETLLFKKKKNYAIIDVVFPSFFRINYNYVYIILI